MRAGRVHLAEAGEIGAATSQLIVVCLDGVVRELVVVAIVTDGRGKLRRGAEAVFPYLGEDRIEGLAANLNSLAVESERRYEREDSEGKGYGFQCFHGFAMVVIADRCKRSLSAKGAKGIATARRERRIES